MQSDDQLVGARFQHLQPPFGFAKQARRTLMGGNQLVEGRRALGEQRDGALEAGKQRLKAECLGALALARKLQLFGRFHVTLAATLPRMPFTNLPASSPEKVLASSIDSLMAALVGTCRSMVIS